MTGVQLPAGDLLTDVRRGPQAARRDGRTLRLVVLGDSTAFTDARGPQLPGTAGLYPQVTGSHLRRALGLDVEVIVIARAGSTVSELERTLFKDQHVQFDIVGPADAVVVGIGSFDHAPAGVPAPLQALLPFVRGDRRRRALRRLVHDSYPRLVRLRGAYAARTPWPVFARRYEATLRQVRGLTLGAAPVVALGPTSHRADYYGQRHPGHVLAERAHLDLAGRLADAALPVWSVVLDADEPLNPDGIHWPAGVHAAIGRQVAEALLDHWRVADEAP